MTSGGARGSSTQAEGAAPASDWFAWERAGRVPPSRRRATASAPVRRGLRAVRGVRAHAPPALDRVGAHRARGGPARRRRDRALPRDADRGARRRGVDRGCASTTSRCRVVHRDRRGRVRRRPRAFVLLGPSRRVLRGDVRRPRVRVEADQRAGRVRVDLPHWRPTADSTGDGVRRARRRRCSRSATRGASCAAAASRSRRSTTSRRSSRSARRCRRRESPSARGR